MQNLSKSELISVLDFMFEVQKITDSNGLYKSMEKLARTVLRCDQLLLGTCSTETASSVFQFNHLENLFAHEDQRAAGYEFPFYSDAPAKSVCQSSQCASSDDERTVSSSINMTSNEDGILICNYPARSRPVCAAFVGKDNERSKNQQLIDSLTPYLSSAIERISTNVAALGKSTKKTTPDTSKQTDEKDPVFLTTREKEILQWASSGKSCWEIGSIIGISERTVKFHLQNVYRKLEVVNRAQAVSVAFQRALM